MDSVLGLINPAPAACLVKFSVSPGGIANFDRRVRGAGLDCPDGCQKWPLKKKDSRPLTYGGVDNGLSSSSLTVYRSIKFIRPAANRPPDACLIQPDQFTGLLIFLALWGGWASALAWRPRRPPPRFFSGLFRASPFASARVIRFADRVSCPIYWQTPAGLRHGGSPVLVVLVVQPTAMEHDIGTPKPDKPEPKTAMG